MTATDASLVRIGVLGGMFDPVHRGHTDAALLVAGVLGLQKVLLVPCGNPVHRADSMATAQERCRMVLLAIAGLPLLQLETRECDSVQPSYTIDTINALQLEQPAVSWHLLVGMDAFLALPTWKQWQSLVAQVNLVIMTRPGYGLSESALAPALLAEWQRRQVKDSSLLATHDKGCMAIIDVKTGDFSSSKVRALLKTGEDTGSILHPAVAKHIRQHRLYQSGE